MTRAFKHLRLPIWFGPRVLLAAGVLALLFGIGGVSSSVHALAIIASGALVLAIALDALAGPGHRLIAIERESIENFSLRSRGTLHYAVHNRSAHAIRVGIFDTPVPQLQFETDEVLVNVPAYARAAVVRDVIPVRRGRANLSEVYCWYENSWGLLRRRMQAPAAAEIRVYPDLSAVERFGKLHARNRLIEAGLRRMRLRGIGTEFESLREWSTGDSFRSIDWKATARRGRTMVAQYEVERSQNVMLVLDAGRLMTARVGDQRKFDYALTAALSAAAIAGLANDKVGLVAFAADILAAQAPRSTRASLAHLTENVHDLEPRFEESDYDAAFAYLRTHLHKRSLVLFFTDMVDPVAQAMVLAHVRSIAKRHVVVCAFMNDAAIEGRLVSEPRTVLDVYETSVALALRQERRTAAAVLERLGAYVIDVPAQLLTTALIDEYLRIKTRGLV